MAAGIDPAPHQHGTHCLDVAMATGTGKGTRCLDVVVSTSTAHAASTWW